MGLWKTWRTRRWNLSSWRDRVEEWAVVFEGSRKTQLCLALAFVFPALILTFGDYLVSRVTFAPPFTPLTTTVREALSHRYLEAALTAFFGFMSAAATCFAKYRRKLFEGR
jgi:hypothetical protein